MEHSISESKVSAVLNEFELTNRIPSIFHLSRGAPLHDSKSWKIRKFHLSILSLCTENHKHASSQQKFQWSRAENLALLSTENTTNIQIKKFCKLNFMYMILLIFSSRNNYLPQPMWCLSSSPSPRTSVQ